MQHLLICIDFWDAIVDLDALLVLYTSSCFFCVAFKFCTLSKALRTGDAVFFPPVYVVLTHRGLLVKLFCSLQEAATLCNFVFLSLSLRNNISCHPSHERVGGRKPPSFSFQGFPDHVYVFSFLLRSFVEVLPSSLFSFLSISSPSFSFPLEIFIS